MNRPNQDRNPGSRAPNLQPNNLHPNSQHLDPLLKEYNGISQELQPPSTKPQNLNQASNLSSMYRKKAVKVIKILIQCLPIINFILFVAMWLSFFRREDNYKEMNEREQIFQLMSENLKADPIIEIQLINERSTCPSDFKAEKLADWLGTSAGCLCENGDLHSTPCWKISPPNCNIDIPKTHPVEMYEWDDSIFCVKRAVLGTDYLREAECPEGYQECYPGGCFLKGDCPITKLEITSTEETSNKFNGKDKYLVSRKIQGEPPLIHIQISLSEIPLLTQDLSSKILTGFSHKLSAVKEHKWNNKYEQNINFSTKVASQTAYDSFAQNSFSYPAMHLPHFAETANATISLLSSTARMKTARYEHCQDVDVNLIRDHYSTSRYPPIFDIFMIAVIIFLQILCIWMTLNHWISKSKHNPKPCCSDDLIRGTFRVHMIVCILLIPRAFWTSGVWQKFMLMKKSFEEYLTLECFERDQGNEVMRDYLEGLKEKGTGFSIDLMFWLAHIGSIFVFGWYLLGKKRIVIRYSET